MRYQDLVLFYNGEKAYWVKAPDGKIIGKGLMETELEEQGFDKSELRKLVASSILKKFQVKVKGAIRNSYVLMIGGS